MSEFHDISMNSEEARTVRRLQWGVQVKYRDGRVHVWIRENEFSARRQVEIQEQMMNELADWGVIEATLVHRMVEMTLGQWAAADDEAQYHDVATTDLNID